MPHPSAVGGSYRIDTRNPVSDHPLNQGIMSWWLGLPNNSGGPRWFDLLGRFSAEAKAALTWQASPHFKTPYQDGTGYWYTGTTTDQYYSGATLSVAFRTSGAGSSFRGVAVKQNAFGIFLNDNKLGWYDWTGATSNFTAATYNDSRWHYASLAFTSGSTNGTRLYVDGVNVVTGTLTLFANNRRLVFSTGSDDTDTISRNGQIYTGDLGTVRLSQTVYSASHAWAEYDQWLRGFPDLLRRIPSRVWSFGGDAGGGGGTVQAVGASSGSATVAGTSKASKKAAYASDGTGVVVSSSKASKAAVYASAGAGAVSGVGRWSAKAVWSSAGTATVTGVGGASNEGAFASAGAATVAATGAATKKAVYAAAGLGSASGTGRWRASAVWSAAGSSTCAAVSQNNILQGVGASDGTATASGVGSCIFSAVGSSSGSSTCLGRSPASGVGGRMLLKGV